MNTDALLIFSLSLTLPSPNPSGHYYLMSNGYHTNYTGCGNTLHLSQMVRLVSQLEVFSFFDTPTLIWQLLKTKTYFIHTYYTCSKRFLYYVAFGLGLAVVHSWELWAAWFTERRFEACEQSQLHRVDLGLSSLLGSGHACVLGRICWGYGSFGKHYP